jgi:hypothetical protein
MNALCMLLVLVVSQAPVVEAPSDDAYDTLLVDIDGGNTDLAQALQRGDRRPQVGALLEAQQQRFRDRGVLAARLSEGRRQRNATLSPATFEGIRRDGAFLALWTTATVVVTIPDQLERVQDRSAADIASLVAHALALAALVAVTIFVARAGTSVLQRGRLWVARQHGDRAVLAAGTHAFTIAAHMLSPLIGVVAVAGIAGILDDVADHVLVVLVLRALHIMVWVRVGVAAVVLLIEALASTPLGGLSPSLVLRVRTQVTSAGRTVVGGWFVAVWCEVVLIDGALVGLARTVAALAVLVALVAVVAHFRDEIAARYLELQPRGSLADAVKAQRTRTFGFAVAAAALTVVALQALVGSLQRFLLGFAETRRALAYVFRRRLERDAQQRQTPPVRPLPLAVVNALSDAPEDADEELASISTRFADDLTRLERSVSTWMEHRDRVGAGRTSGARQVHVVAVCVGAAVDDGTARHTCAAPWSSAQRACPFSHARERVVVAGQRPHA